MLRHASTWPSCTIAMSVEKKMGSIIETQDALGHKHPVTTRVYVQRVAVKKDRHSTSIRIGWISDHYGWYLQTTVTHSFLPGDCRFESRWARQVKAQEVWKNHSGLLRVVYPSCRRLRGSKCTAGLGQKDGRTIIEMHLPFLFHGQHKYYVILAEGMVNQSS